MYFNTISYEYYQVEFQTDSSDQYLVVIIKCDKSQAKIKTEMNRLLISLRTEDTVQAALVIRRLFICKSAFHIGKYCQNDHFPVKSGVFNCEFKIHGLT